MIRRLIARGGLSRVPKPVYASPDMSKAFTRESDDLPERPPVAPPPSSLPPGTRNYITPAGAVRLREELEKLLGEPRSTDARVQSRIASLERSLQAMEVVPPPPPPHEEVRFGATVTVRDSSGCEEKFRLVGIDETDIDRDWISWLSPLARALTGSRIGERVRIKLPAGDRELVVVSVAYQ